jgi:hypothetical protein
MNNEVAFRIRKGTVSFIYDDSAAGLLERSRYEVTRASRVEPAPNGGWYADMGPSDGPVLFANGAFDSIDGDGQGFQTRQAALAAEVAWLKANKGL